MPTKHRRVVALGRTGRLFQELYLDSGDRVEIPHALMAVLTGAYTAHQELVFVERRGRLFNYVQWFGTLEEAREARDRGELIPAEVPF